MVAARDGTFRIVADGKTHAFGPYHTRKHELAYPPSITQTLIYVATMPISELPRQSLPVEAIV